MTLDTDEGPMVVPVEMDLTQASKSADEKRKRNAGASARFRARRKEKEIEASQTINNMKLEMDELRAQRDFYRRERDFIRDFATSHIAARLPDRPPSPIPYHTTTESADSPQEGSEPPSETGPIVRRRRTDESLYTSSRPDLTNVQGYGSLYPSQAPMTLPRPTASQSAGGFGPAIPGGSSMAAMPGLPQGVQRSQSTYDPFRRGPFEKTWEQGR